MKLPYPICSSRLALAGHFALAAAFAPLALAQDATKPDTKMPPVKVDPSPLPQVTGTVTTFAPIVDKVAPSVVTIATSKLMKRSDNPMLNDPTFRRFFGIPDQDEESTPRGGKRGDGRKRKQLFGLGSGVIVSADGHIITNNHVIEGADEIVVTIGNEKHEYIAKKIGTDPGTDIALLKIEQTNLRPITFADSDKLRVGDLAIAVGNPFNLTQSVTMGIVSALGRSGTGITEYENFIQTDAAINMGNSGGALVDTEGRLIGINTAIFSRTGGNQGIGFAVPSNIARTVMEGLLKTGHVTRGFLGIQLQPLTEDLAKQFKLDSTSGALVNEVQPKSPSEKAGIQSGDVVVAVNGKKVEGPRELQLLVAGLAPGTKVDVEVLRDGKDKKFTVELAERPTPRGATASTESPSEDPDVLDGVTVGDIDAEARKQFEIPENVRSGVVVSKIDADSPSAEAGIRVGDVIVEVNREPITNAKQAVDLSEKLKKEKKVLLRVSSKGASRYVVVERKD
ncbi:MAG: serine protease Do [Chthoniobacter sp.]|jgi:serine protease Do|nr:serine protease Do [Chthoniobacter sp.]